MFRIFLSVLVIFVATGTSFAADQLVIVAATVTDGKPVAGDIFKSTETLSLKDGERLTLMSENGQIVQLDGPRTGPILAEALPNNTTSNWPDGLTRVAGLVSGAAGHTNVLGASRKPDGTQGIAEQPDIWLVNTDSSGERCIRPSHLELWRRNAGNDSAVTVRGERERLPKAVWARNSNRLPLPGRLAQDGDRLVLSIDKQPRRYTLHVLPEGVGEKDWGVVLRWMVDKNCKRQAVLLIGKLHGTTN